MDDHLLGCTFALLAALSWALAVLLFKIGGERIPPLALNLFKNLLAAVLIVITLAVIGDLTGLMEEGLGTIRDFSTREILLLSLSGLLGITLADTCFFYSLNIVGVGITGIVDCLYTPSLVILSWLFLGEVLTGPQYLGALLIVAAVAVTARHEPPEGVSRGRLLTGILLNVFSKVIMAVAIVIVKDLFETKPIWWTTLLRTAAGALSLMLLLTVLPRQRRLFAVLRPSRTWLVILPGSFLGAYLALLFWTAGFKYIKVGQAGALNQTSTVFSLLLAAVVLKEAFTRRKLVAVILAMTGIVLVTLLGE